MYDTLEEFYLAEALEYIEAWQQSSPDNPAGICGPIGPTEQLPLVARIVNAVGLDLKKCDAHFWGMDEWVLDGKPVGFDHSRLYDEVRCVVMQGGQGDVKHWAFNDPVKREGKWIDEPPTPEEYRQFRTRIVDLHPMTIMQNARTSGGGNISLVPTPLSGKPATMTIRSACV